MKFLLQISPAAILLLSVLACDAWVSVDGIVTDDANRPLADAKVVIKQGNHTVGEYSTDEFGKFHAFDNIAPFPFSFTSQLDCFVSKAGYETKDVKIDGNERRTPDNPLRIILVRN